MKKIIIASIFLLLANTTFAQTNKPSVSADVKRQIEILKSSDLNLSDIQISRITTVLMGEEEIRVRNERVLEGNKSLLEKRLQELKANRISNIKGGMTSQQAEKFEALKLADKL